MRALPSLFLLLSLAMRPIINVDGNDTTDVFIGGRGCGGPGREIRVRDHRFYDVGGGGDGSDDGCVYVVKVDDEGIDEKRGFPGGWAGCCT